MFPGHKSFHPAGDRTQRGSPRGFHHNRLGEWGHISTNQPSFLWSFFRVFSPSITNFPCYDLLSFPGSFHDPHLAGVHLVSKLRSWDNGRSSPKEISGWLLCINWLKLWFFNNPKTWSSRANNVCLLFHRKTPYIRRLQVVAYHWKRFGSHWLFPNRTYGGWAQNLLPQRIVFTRGTHLQVHCHIISLALSWSIPVLGSTWGYLQ